MIKGNRQVLFITGEYSKPRTRISWSALGAILAIASGLKPIKVEYHEFDNGGLTLIYFLEESHLCIDTYPEYNIFEIMLQSCKGFDIIKILATIADSGLKVLNFTDVCKNKEHKWQHCLNVKQIINI